MNKSKEISKKFEVYLFQIQVDSGGKVSILGGDSIGHCEKKKVHVNIRLILNGYCLLIGFLYVGLDEEQTLQKKGRYIG